MTKPKEPKKPVKPKLKHEKPELFKGYFSSYAVIEADYQTDLPYVRMNLQSLDRPDDIRRFAAWLLKAASWIEFNQQKKGKK